MSKSLGNFLTIDDVLERGFSPRALRLLFLTSHYRSEMNFTWDNLAGSQKAWDRLVREMLKLKNSIGDIDDPTKYGLSVQAQSYEKRFFQLIEDDLRTAEAVALMWEVLKDEQLADAEKYQLLLSFDQVLGLGLAELTEADLAEMDLPAIDPADLPTDARQLFDRRATARQDQDWAQADQLRDQLADLGYQVTDTDGGQKIVQL
jgi:cysteinyl-tRNA synthetase